ncbi:hypothetical protein TNCV_1559771 [Trichonephila clavipes]|nr:hypothetical protein TNCV_1559771 [Trichonephila clavipes]
MVVDTGANVSIIRKDLAQNSQVSIIWTPPCVSLQTVTSDKIEVHGKANITLRFGNIDYHHTAYIADITDPCILGLDFLKNNNFKLDFENSNMHSKLEDISLFGLQTQLESNQKIIAKTKLSLLPRTECIIPGSVAENRKFRLGLIDYPDPANSKRGVLIASSVVDLSKSVIPVQYPRPLFRGSSQGFTTKHGLGREAKRCCTIVKSLGISDRLIRKKNVSTRFCVDYRRLNDVTKKEIYPLPRIDDTLDTLASNTWFSILDLKSGYWQVELHPDDKEKTAFTTGQRLWQFKVMHFGLCNAPATFERLMETVLGGLSYEDCLVYLDDIIIVGNSFDKHLKNIRRVLQKPKEAKPT